MYLLTLLACVHCLPTSHHFRGERDYCPTVPSYVPEDMTGSLRDSCLPWALFLKESLSIIKPACFCKRRELRTAKTLQWKAHSRLKCEPRCLRQQQPVLQGRIVCRTEHACRKFRLMNAVKVPGATGVSSISSTRGSLPVSFFIVVYSESFYCCKSFYDWHSVT